MKALSALEAEKKNTNLRFAGDLVGSAGEEEELPNSAERLDKASTAYDVEISAEKTRLMTNNTIGMNTAIKVKLTQARNCQKLQVSGSSYNW